MWTREDLAYAAGLFEGEGHVGFNNRAKAPKLTVDSTDLDVLERLLACVKVGTICGPYLRGTRPGNKPIWRWHVQNQAHAYALAVALYGFLGKRRRERIREVITIWVGCT